MVAALVHHTFGLFLCFPCDGVRLGGQLQRIGFLEAFPHRKGVHRSGIILPFVVSISITLTTYAPKSDFGPEPRS